MKVPYFSLWFLGLVSLSLPILLVAFPPLRHRPVKLAGIFLCDPAWSADAYDLHLHRRLVHDGHPKWWSWQERIDCGRMSSLQISTCTLFL